MFARVGKKGRDQNKQQNRKLLIPVMMLRADCHHAVGTDCPELSVAPRVVCRELSWKMAVLAVRGCGAVCLFVQRLRLSSSSSAFLSPCCHTVTISGASTDVFQDTRWDSLPVFAKAEQTFQLSC